MYTFDSIRIVVYPRQENETTLFLKKYSHFFENIAFLNAEKKAFVVDTILDKEEFDKLISKHIKDFLSFKIAPPPLNELLDKICNKKQLTLSEQKQMIKYSQLN